MKSIYATAAICIALAAADSGIDFPTVSFATPTYTDTARLASASSAIERDYTSFVSSLTAQPEYTAFASAIASAVGSDGSIDPTDLLQATIAGTPTWWTKLPTSAQAYVTSVAAQEQSIYNKDVTGAAAPTPAPMMKAAVAGAGAFAGAVLLL